MTCEGDAVRMAAPAFPKTARGSSALDINDLAKQPADVSAVITAVLALDTKDGDPPTGRVDSTKIAAGGHSLGGMTTVGLFSSYARDTRIKTGIVMAGSARTVGTDYPDPAPSMLFVHGELDRVVYPADGRAAYDPFPGKKAWLRLEAGDHLGPYIGTDYELTLSVTQTSLDYLRWALHGDEPSLKRFNATVDIESKLS